MRCFGSQVVWWASVLLGIVALGLLEGTRSADATPTRDVVITATQSASERWSGMVIAVFVGAALLVALWRVVLFLLAAALLGVVLLGALVLVTGGPPSDDTRTDGAGPLHGSAVVLDERGLSC